MSLDSLGSGVHLTQPPDSFNMAPVDVGKSRVRVVRDLEFLASSLDDLRDGRVVDVADSREQVVFNLEVKTALNSS